MNKILVIEGMMCERCKKHVEDALKKLTSEVEVDLKEGKAYLKNCNLDNEKLKEVIEKAGYELKDITNS